jgi:hypothetical protein
LKVDCRTPIVSTGVVGAPGAPGGVLPAGGDQWSFLQFNGTLWVPSWVMPETVTAPEAGEVLIAVGDNEADFQVPIGNSLLYRSASVAIGVAGGTWLQQWTTSTDASVTMNAAGFAVALLSGNLRWLRIFHSTPVASADIITYTIVVNGVDTLLTVSLATGASGPASNLDVIVPVTQGDLISARADGATGGIALRSGLDFLLEY